MKNLSLEIDQPEDIHGLTVTVRRDECTYNPIEDSCGYAPMAIVGDRYENTLKTDDIDHLYRELVCERLKPRHYRPLFDLLDLNIECIERADFDSLGDALYNEITEAMYSYSACSDMDMVEEILQIVGAPHYRGTTQGYCQGDWADCLVIYDDEFFTRTGCDPESFDTEMNGATQVEMYGHWAWGNVYYYTIEDAQSDILGSCGGYYGYDHDESGLADAVRDEIAHIRGNALQYRIERIKAWVKNNVPLSNRVFPEFAQIA